MCVDQLPVFPTQYACSGGKNEVIDRKIRRKNLLGRVEIPAGCNDAKAFFLSCPMKTFDSCSADLSFTGQYGSIKIGDEVTTIGGIVGRVVNVKEDTIVIETTKDRTKIRFLKSAVKSVDVKAESAE